LLFCREIISQPRPVFPRKSSAVEAPEAEISANLLTVLSLFSRCFGYRNEEIGIHTVETSKLLCS